MRENNNHWAFDKGLPFSTSLIDLCMAYEKKPPMRSVSKRYTEISADVIRDIGQRAQSRKMLSGVGWKDKAVQNDVAKNILRVRYLWETFFK